MHVATFVGQVSRDTSPSGVSTSVLSLVDVRNKLVAGTFNMADVQHVMVAWGVVVLITGGRPVQQSFLWLVAGTCAEFLV